jgi:hypothetical protein
MAEPKTQPTTQSVASYLDAIEDDVRRKDCKALHAMMKRATGCAPKMWGEAIVGYDSYRMTYANGKTGDWPVVGFSARRGPISVYLMAGYDGAEDLLAKLGKHKIGKACLYIHKLAEVQLPVLEQMIERSVAQMRQRHPRAS